MATLFRVAIFPGDVVLVFKNRPGATLITGIFLLLGVFNLVAITPTITTHRFCIMSLCTPNMQGLFLFLFTGYFIMNLKILINMELDYKERKAARKQSRL